MDRQTRNIGLFTLLLAALTIIAVVSPEKERSTTNTAILYVAKVAAVGSVVFLVGSARPLRIAAKDAAKWWEKRRRHTKWHAFHYRARERVITIPKDDAIRSLGMPCIVLVIEPPRRIWHRDPAATLVDRLHRYAQQLKGFEVVCSVSGWGVAQRSVKVEMEPRAALARFPDEYFGRPGKYRAEWTITTPDGTTERARDTIRLHNHGHTRADLLRRSLERARKVTRHLLGHDLKV